MSNAILKNNLESLEKQLEWLRYSYLKCERIGIRENYTNEEFDYFETLCSRFARSLDFLIRRVFRSIDDVEYEIQGTLIDVVNNALKRGLIKNEEEIREIRDIRNEIVHEYVDEGLLELLEVVLNNTNSLITIIESTIKYCEKYK
ncbi:MAG: hypothetical protein K9J12_09800 [Melioribacteraceae bacterium]|nr:hypothetical protein [Melioribacteraceae bacterium]MCF8266111.1 hypothetical protein [Melioribacteraceae bacterium]MCF8431501.1 hypothetical protein [Melioribacteraceae bacterium]